jgi:hypothetical protein
MCDSRSESLRRLPLRVVPYRSGRDLCGVAAPHGQAEGRRPIGAALPFLSLWAYVAAGVAAPESRNRSRWTMSPGFHGAPSTGRMNRSAPQ